MKMMRYRLCNFFSIKPEARWYLLQTAVLLVVVTLSLRLLRYRRTHIALGYLVKMSRRSKTKHHNTSHVMQALLLANQRIKYHSPLRGRCLSRSLVLWTLLQRKGIPVQLCIGQSWQNSVFKAHAWVEYQAIPLNAGDKVRQHYTAFETELLRHALGKISA